MGNDKLPVKKDEQTFLVPVNEKTKEKTIEKLRKEIGEYEPLESIAESDYDIIETDEGEIDPETTIEEAIKDNFI